MLAIVPASILWPSAACMLLLVATWCRVMLVTRASHLEGQVKNIDYHATIFEYKLDFLADNVPVLFVIRTTYLGYG